MDVSRNNAAVWVRRPRPQLAPLEIQAIQSREFETVKPTAFAAVLSVFQDLGYIVESADKDTGFITAKSPTSGGFSLLTGQTLQSATKATAFVEELQPRPHKGAFEFRRRESGLLETGPGVAARRACSGHEDLCQCV